MSRSRRWRPLFAVLAVWSIGAWFMLGPNSNFQKLRYGTLNGQQPGSRVSDGRLQWQKFVDRYPVTAQAALPTDKAAARIPKIQTTRPKESAAERNVRLERQAAVKASFQHSWNGYKEHAWLQDEVTPLSGQARNPFGGWAATLVDALDTLWIMEMKDDFKEAVKACSQINFAYSASKEINVFETTIRYLGGFLASYELSQKTQKILLSKAVEVGDLLMSAFDTPNRMPITRWNWADYTRGYLQVAPNTMLISEVGSLSLEFTKLSQLTGDMRYYDAVQRIMDVFEKAQDSTKLPGMWPIVMDAEEENFGVNGDFTLGGMSDSLYEYLPKQYMLLGGRSNQPRRMYESFIDVAKKHLFHRAIAPWSSPILFSSDAHVRGEVVDPEYRGQHLTCFTGGMVGIASRIFERPQDLDVAIQLTDGCVWAYNTTETGIGPEIFSFMPCGRVDDDPHDSNCRWSEDKWFKHVEDHWWSESSDDSDRPSLTQIKGVIQTKMLPRGMVDVQDRRYILRPEAIESVFMMYRITGDPTWMDKAWQMFTQVEKFTRTDVAASALDDITKATPSQMDSMESFWLAETLKYYYLIFSEWDLIDLDEWVLNTEAHPLRRI